MQARGVAPAIIFIDEIDAVGRTRGGAQGNDERDTTLNQMLSEMDGFGEGVGVIVMAATNRKDVLDPALIRPGRFDRIIQVGLPDLMGRVETFQVGALHSTSHAYQAIDMVMGRHSFIPTGLWEVTRGMLLVVSLNVGPGA